METTLRLGLAVLAISSFLLLSLLFHSSSDVTNYFMRLKKVKDNLKIPLSNFVERKKASESHIPKVFQSRERVVKMTARLEREVLDIIRTPDSPTICVPALKTPHPNISRPLEQRPLVYNRINKAGSSSLMGLLELLASPNHFILLAKGLPKVRSLSGCQEARLARLLCRPGPRLVLSRHLYYIDFAKYGCPVIYINQVRDPVSRFVSRYRFHRRSLSLKRTEEELEKVSGVLERLVEECIMSGDPECQYRGKVAEGRHGDWRVASLTALDLSRIKQSFSFLPDSMIPFFCGTSPSCRSLGSSQALDTSLRRLDKDFTVVTALEKMEEGLEVLECLLPGYFKGVVKLQTSLNLHLNSDTKKQRGLEGEALEVLEGRLQPERQFYSAVTTRLAAQLEDCRNGEHLSIVKL